MSSLDKIRLQQRFSVLVVAKSWPAARQLPSAITTRPLTVIFAVALAARLTAMALFAGPIDGEGAEYSRIAQNLLAGVGYSGIAEPGPQLFFPPLFPYLIAAITLLTGDAEIAGRLISIVLGSLVVLLVGRIGTKLYDRRCGLASAAIASLHPYLVEMSTTVNVEMTFLALILAAISAAFTALENPSRMIFAATGALFGLCYLVRSEALLYMLVAGSLAGFYLLTTGLAKSLVVARRIGLMLAVFSVLASPYAVWLSGQTDSFRLEGKSPLNITTQRRILGGMNFIDAQFGVSKDLKETGVWNQPNLAIIDGYSITFSELTSFLIARAKPVLSGALTTVASEYVLGSPVLFALAILGLFGRPWNYLTTIRQMILFAALGLTVVGTLFIYYTTERFYILFVPLLVVWASAGLRRLASWATATGATIGLARRFRPMLGTLVWALGTAALVSVSATSVGPRLIRTRAERPIQTAAELLHEGADGPLRVAASGTVIAFHAGATHVWLPYCDEETALGYFAHTGVSHVVLRESDASVYPYLARWISDGIPDPRASLVRVLNAGQETVTIYAFNVAGKSHRNAPD